MYNYNLQLNVLLDGYCNIHQWRSFNQNIDNTEVRTNQQTNEWQDNNYTPLTIKDGVKKIIVSMVYTATCY